MAVKDNEKDLSTKDETFWEISNNMLQISVPALIANTTHFLAETINTRYVGHMGDTAMMAGVGLGNMFVNIICMATLQGGALDGCPFLHFHGLKYVRFT